MVGGGNVVYHNYQTSPGGGWSGWIPIGGSIASPPTVAMNADGRLQLFAQGTDTAGWYAWQLLPGNGGWSEWVSLGGSISASPSATQNADGRLEIFGIAANAVFNNWQTSPGGAWSGWNPLGCCLVSTPNVGINDDGRLELFAEGTDGAAWHAWQQTAGSTWGSWQSLGGWIQGSPSVDLDGNAALDSFALGGSAIYEDWQLSPGGAWNGWSPLGGVVVAPPATAMNFDGRLEMFAIGANGAVYHEWQLSAAGAWSGWALLTTPSNAGADTTFDVTFLTDSQNESNFASVKSGGYAPPWLSTLTAWPCGARVNISITGYNKKALSPFQNAVGHWNQGLFDYYSSTYSVPAVPVQLYISAGGPQTLSVSRAKSDSLPPDPNNPNGHARAQTGHWGQDASGRLFSATTQVIRSMSNSTTLTNTFAHELGHTFGLNDCNMHPACGTTTYVNNRYTVWSYTVMDTSEPAPPGSTGWDNAAKNFTEGLPSPVQADLQVIDSHLPDYRQCGLAENGPPPDVPSCTNGAAVGFMDTGSGSTYTCNGTPCDGCNSACSNFAPQACGGTGDGGGGSGSPSCSNWCGEICMDGATCESGGVPQCALEDEGWVPICNTCPIVIDAFGEGFHLTGLSSGVQFRVLPGDGPSQMSWTDPQWRNGWLALDRNGNGTIDDFTELFGNFTPQSKGNDPNGYIALALFDDPMNGGNNNGVIDPDDSVYDHLRLWIDANHNGVSEPEELHALRDVGIFRIDLEYHSSSYVDQNGNSFRYKSRIWDETGRAHNVCYDVFLHVKAHTASGSN